MTDPVIITIDDRWGLRGGTAADMETVNEKPLNREGVIETDTGRIKVGTGSGYFNDLKYITPGFFDLSARADGYTFAWDDAAGHYKMVPQSGGTGIAEGTSFPGSPSNNDLFRRTDRNLIYFYKSSISQWLTIQLFEVGIGGQQQVFPNSAGTSQSWIWWPIRQDYGIYLERLICTTFVGSPNGASDYYTVSLHRFSGANVATSIASFTTAADSHSNWVNHDQAINAVLDASARALRIGGSRSGNPGTAYALSTLSYRLIG